jgi:hypothetical protein
MCVENFAFIGQMHALSVSKITSKTHNDFLISNNIYLKRKNQPQGGNMPMNCSTERSKSNRELEWTEFYVAWPLAIDIILVLDNTVRPKGKCLIVLKDTVRYDSFVH